MRRGIVLSVRDSEDKETHEKQLWVTVGKLPVIDRKTGRVYAPKSTETIVVTMAGELRTPDKYSSFKSLKPGDLVEINFGVNEYTEKTYVDSLVVIVPSPYTVKDLYGE